MKERAGRAPGILKQDGLAILLGKTSHMVRREAQGTDVPAASFVGHVVEDNSMIPETFVGQRVAGASITHPAVSEFVIARPEFIFPVDESCDEALASLALYGGLAVYAADEAMRATDAGIGVTGSGVLAHIVASILATDGRAVVRTGGEGSLLLRDSEDRGPGSVERPGDAEVWIATARSASPNLIEARQVIGVATPLRSVRLDWPNAQSHSSADVGDVVRGGEHIVDLFYDDGELELPAWLEPSHIARYLELVGAGHVSPGAVPEPLDLPPASLDEERRAERDNRPRSARERIALVSFPSSVAPPESQRLDLHTTRPFAAMKTVSVVGAGEWPVGMILRQILRDKRVALRGACDRRPEVLHLAQQALPFEFLTTSYDDLLNDDDTDMIVVAPFHGAHAPLAASALRAGKHCFLEKPPAVDHDQLELLIDAAKSSNGFLYVGYNRRFAPATEILMDHLAREDGPLTINIVVHGIPLPRNHWYFWPSNGNRIISNSCHFIDYALALSEPAMPSRVTATPALIGRPDEDVIITVAFDDGSIASITYTKRGSDRRPIYYQSYHVMKGAVTGLIEDFARLTVHRKRKRVAAWRGPVDLGHRRQMALVADALATNGKSPVTLDAAITSARTLLAAAESARSGEPVDLKTW